MVMGLDLGEMLLPLDPYLVLVHGLLSQLNL